MDFDATLDQLNKMLTPPGTLAMTKAQFEAYVADQIGKAKKEKEEDACKCQKRLTHLRDVVQRFKSWDGDNGTQAIPVYEEPGLSRSAEKSETEVPLQNVTSMAAAGWAGAGGLTDFSKAVDELHETVGKLGAPTGGAAPSAPLQQSTFEWPSDVADAEYLKAGIAKRDLTWGKDPQ